MKWTGIGLLAAGGVAVALFAAVQWSTGTFEGKLDAADVILSGILEVVGALELALPGFASVLGTIMGVLRLFQSAIDLVKSLASNWWTSAAADVAMFLAGGPFYLLSVAVLKFLAGFIIDGVIHQAGKWGLAAIAAGATLLGAWGQQKQMADNINIVDWCNQNGGCPERPQSSFTFQV